MSHFTAPKARARAKADEPIPSRVWPVALKPRRGLTWALGIALIVWMVVLVVMYARTVYPERKAGPGPSTQIPLP